MSKESVSKNCKTTSSVNTRGSRVWYRAGSGSKSGTFLWSLWVDKLNPISSVQQLCHELQQCGVFWRSQNKTKLKETTQIIFSFQKIYAFFKHIRKQIFFASKNQWSIKRHMSTSVPMLDHSLSCRSEKAIIPIWLFVGLKNCHTEWVHKSMSSWLM